MLNPSVPFGGYKQSGVGVEGGQEGIEAYTKVHNAIVKLTLVPGSSMIFLTMSYGMWTSVMSQIPWGNIVAFNTEVSACDSVVALRPVCSIRFRNFEHMSYDASALPFCHAALTITHFTQILLGYSSFKNKANSSRLMPWRAGFWYLLHNTQECSVSFNTPWCWWHGCACCRPNQSWCHSRDIAGSKQAASIFLRQNGRKHGVVQQAF